MDVFFRGGPYPWFGQPLDHFIKGEFAYKPAIYSGFKINLNILTRSYYFCNLVIDDAPDVIRAVRNLEASGKMDTEAKKWEDSHVVTVTCLAEGTGMFALMVGNYIREESKESYV